MKTFLFVNKLSLLNKNIKQIENTFTSQLILKVTTQVLEMKFVEIILAFLAISLVEVESEGCGERQIEKNEFSGEEFNRDNDWPWVVAFFHWPDEQFFAGGSLISNRHVLGGE